MGHSHSHITLMGIGYIEHEKQGLVLEGSEIQ